MQPIPHVRTQVGLFWIATAVAVMLCGDAVGFALAGIVAVSAAGVMALGVSYHFARRARLRDACLHESSEAAAVSSRRLRDDRKMAALCAIGFLAPAAVAAAILAGWRFEGLVFHSTAASLAAELVVAATAAIVVSSAVDWYLITPFQRAVLNTPLCQSDDNPGVQSRRAHTQWWLVHRGLCELVSYFAISVDLAIIFAALANLVEKDRTLSTAIGSFIGAGTAFFLAAYMVRRTIPAWEYIQEQPVGLGNWATGRDALGERVEGFVVDVAIGAGIQLSPHPEKASVLVDLQDLTSSKVPARIQTAHRPLDVPCDPGTCRRWIAECDRQYRLTEDPSRQETRSTRPSTAG